MELVIRFPLYPATFGAAFVLTRFLATGELFPVVIRPLVVVVLVAILAQLIAGLMTRNRHIGAFVATLGAAMVTDPVVGLFVLLTASGPLVFGLVRSRRMARIDWPRVTAFLTFVGTVALVLNGVLAMSRVVTTLQAGVVRPAGDVGQPPSGAPDIYLIMLDGYPRADTLAHDFSFDNSPFLRSMQDLGFDIADQAHSNYNATLLTLSSVLNMKHVDDVIPSPPGQPGHAAALIRSINAGEALQALWRAGYVVASIPSGITTTAVFSVDRYLDTGQINSFEMSLAKSGVLPNLLPDLQRSWFYAQHRDRIRSAFDRLATLAGEDVVSPRFVFAHVMSPHAPIVFNADGSPHVELRCIPQTCALWDEHRGPDEDAELPGQVAYLNTLVFDTVRRVLASTKRPAVIVVFSDHGSRHDLGDRDEMLRNLFVAYTPGRPGLFPSDASPVNIIPRILNAYVGAEIPLATEEAYEIDLATIGTTGYFPLVPWPINP
ncbi:MAG: LTA synthase family protein [Chloroflexi bacterium]|nr:LTA synthase family protein [Chloroflexota bacterium]